MRLAIQLRDRHFALVQGAVIATLLAASLLGTVYVELNGGVTVPDDRVVIVDVGGEGNIPAFWSALNLVLAAALLLVIALAERNARSPMYTRWLVLSGGFLLMAIDEASRLHEKFGSIVEDRIPIPVLEERSWVIWGALAALAVGIFMIPLIRSLHPRTRLYFIVAAVVFLGGALGFETVAGLVRQAEESEGFAIELLTWVEEAFEMIGVAIFNIALFREIARRRLLVGLELLSGSGG